MSRDDIICMAIDAGARMQQEKNCDVEYLFSFEQLERLLAAEREAVLDLVDDYAKGNTDLRDAIRARGNT